MAAELTLSLVQQISYISEVFFLYHQGSMNLVTLTEIIDWPHDEFGFSPIEQLLKKTEWSVMTGTLDKGLSKKRSMN